MLLTGELFASRFGLGPSITPSSFVDPAEELRRHIAGYEPKPSALAGIPGRAEAGKALPGYLSGKAALAMIDDAAMMQQPGKRDTKQAMEMARQDVSRRMNEAARQSYQQSVSARFGMAVASSTPFAERLVHFWANHFAISVDKPNIIGFAGLLEFEAIRPYVFGRFGDMLKSAEQHPAMLIYLDQGQSFSSNSPAMQFANRFRKLGQRTDNVNENLAREVLELHTLGVGGGYRQSDVLELAKALTGWTVSGLAPARMENTLRSGGEPGQFVFAALVHESGQRKVLGKSYGQEGAGQALAILDDLAVHPATARFVCEKLARHFIADDPPQDLVDRMISAFLSGGGNLVPVYEVMLLSPEASVPERTKVKSPWEWLISVYRTLPLAAPEPQRLMSAMELMGQPVWRPGSPAGFGDRNADWLGSDALFKRVELANVLTKQLGGGQDARALAEALFPRTLSDRTRRLIAGAASSEEAMALLIVSPEFLMR